MNLIDIISLTKAGYKKKDIDELLKLELEPESPAEPEPESVPEETPQELPEESDDESVNDHDTDLEDARKEIEKLKSDLAKLQKENRDKDRSDPAETVTRQKRLEDLVRSYM